MNIGDTVISVNGRDKDKRFLVIATEENYALIANGTTRRFEKPKLKKNKHLKLENKADSSIAGIIENRKLTNNEIRRYLAVTKGEAPDAKR